MRVGLPPHGRPANETALDDGALLIDAPERGRESGCRNVQSLAALSRVAARVQPPGLASA